MNYETQRLPIVTLSLIGLNTLVYVVTLVCFFCTGGESDVWIMHHLWLVPAQSYWWMYLTSMFVHAGIFHLVGNMIFLFLFGCCVEDMIGRVKFTLMYLVGGLAAEFTYIGFSSGHFASTIPMGGASGAISACLGMYLLLRADADIEFKYFLWFFVVRAGEFELPAWIAIGFWFLRDVVGMMIAMFSDLHVSVAYGAHVGGLLAGCFMIGLQKLITRMQKKTDEVSVPFVMPINARLRAATATPHREAMEVPVIYIFQNDRQSGPFTLSHIQSMLQLGSIGPDAFYWSEGMTDWQSVADLAA
ncbi:MAG: rhomboid family intramembrane serine protease [Limisphaerales bacterium]